VTRSSSVGLTANEVDWYAFLERPRLPGPTSHQLESFSSQSVLITGAGGSIGSALALRLAALPPRSIVLLDASEQALFRLEILLNESGFARHFTTILGSTQNLPLLEELFRQHTPTLVFHAAAHKHLPLLEAHPIEAVANNTLGTNTLLNCGRRHGKPRFVLLSTDKAVEPASILGASKNIAEQLTLAHQGIVVRLANVLGSEGSVAERFLHQLATGSPITITEPNAERYFLTCEEAVDLLLTAATSAAPASLLAPDLNRTHSVKSLAHFLIANSQNTASIQTIVTGLKPGEKLTERLTSANEIAVLSNRLGLNQITNSNPPTHRNLASAIVELEASVHERDLPSILQIIHNLVPSYTPSKSILALVEQVNSLHEASTK
jgi:FlaA1/EpsC-like NDP-sugar epimerase